MLAASFGPTGSFTSCVNLWLQSNLESPHFGVILVILLQGGPMVEQVIR